MLTGQADLADRLYSRSHGGSWSERTITGGTDETGMREDIKRYIRQLRLQHQRGVRGEVAAMLRPGDQAPDREVIDKEISRRVAADCLKIASDPNVVTIMRADRQGRASELEREATAAPARDWRGGGPEEPIMEEIRACRRERKGSSRPDIHRILGQSPDQREGLPRRITRSTTARAAAPAAGTLDEGGGKSRSGGDEGSDRSGREDLSTDRAVGDRVERLRADPRAIQR